MFTVFHAYAARYAMMPQSRECLMGWLDFYAATPAGAWLREIDYRHEVRFYWCDAMDGSDIMGAKGFFGNSIYLQNESPEAVQAANWNPKNWPPLIANVAIHELRHLHQKRKYGFLPYLFMAIPGLRQFTLERDAWRISDEAGELIAQEDRRRHEAAAMAHQPAAYARSRLREITERKG